MDPEYIDSKDRAKSCQVYGQVCDQAYSQVYGQAYGQEYSQVIANCQEFFIESREPCQEHKVILRISSFTRDQKWVLTKRTKIHSLEKKFLSK